MNITSPLAFQLLFRHRNRSRFDLTCRESLCSHSLSCFGGHSPEPSTPQNNSRFKKGAKGIGEREKIPIFWSKEVEKNKILPFNPVEMGLVGVCQPQWGSLILRQIGGERKSFNPSPGS